MRFMDFGTVPEAPERNQPALTLIVNTYSLCFNLKLSMGNTDRRGLARSITVSYYAVKTAHWIA